MCKSILIPLIAASMLAACASGPQPMLAPRLLPPASLTQLPSEELPPPTSGRLPDLLANHVETARLYHQLRERFTGLVQWLEATDALR